MDPIIVEDTGVFRATDPAGRIRTLKLAATRRTSPGPAVNGRTGGDANDDDKKNDNYTRKVSMPRQKTSYEGIKVTWRDWTWRQRNGSPIRIINMDDAHLVNTMRGLLRRILPISLAFHYVSFRVNRNKYNDLHKIQDAVYTYATRLMIQHAHQQNFGEGWRRWCDHLTALRLEADARGLDWWDHDRRCRCDGCAMRAREAAKFMEQNPNYRHME